MTEQEAIEELKCYRAQSGTSYPEEIETAIKALEEIQQYRAIGTVEECKNSVLKILEAYNKAIDDFAEIAMKQFTDFDLEHGYPTVTDCKVILRDIEEQLKGGGMDG